MLAGRPQHWLKESANAEGMKVRSSALAVFAGRLGSIPLSKPEELLV
jgi:hypothetical protein